MQKDLAPEWAGAPAMQAGRPVDCLWAETAGSEFKPQVDQAQKNKDTKHYL